MRLSLLSLGVVALLVSGCSTIKHRPFNPVPEPPPQAAPEQSLSKQNSANSSAPKTNQAKITITQTSFNPQLSMFEPESKVDDTVYGHASYYGKWHHGKRTASGERFDMWGYTAAHRNLPLGTKVRVTNLANNKQVLVRINDRGLYSQPKKRIIDLSYQAALSIGMVHDGVAPVRVEILTE